MLGDFAVEEASHYLSSRSERAREQVILRQPAILCYAYRVANERAKHRLLRGYYAYIIAPDGQILSRMDLLCANEHEALRGYCAWLLSG